MVQPEALEIDMAFAGGATSTFYYPIGSVSRLVELVRIDGGEDQQTVRFRNIKVTPHVPLNMGKVPPLYYALQSTGYDDDAHSNEAIVDYTVPLYFHINLFHGIDDKNLIPFPNFQTFEDTLGVSRDMSLHHYWNNCSANLDAAGEFSSLGFKESFSGVAPSSTESNYELDYDDGRHTFFRSSKTGGITLPHGHRIFMLTTARDMDSSGKVQAASSFIQDIQTDSGLSGMFYDVSAAYVEDSKPQGEDQYIHLMNTHAGSEVLDRTTPLLQIDLEYEIDYGGAFDANHAVFQLGGVDVVSAGIAHEGDGLLVFKNDALPILEGGRGDFSVTNLEVYNTTQGLSGTTGYAPKGFYDVIKISSEGYTTILEPKAPIYSQRAITPDNAITSEPTSATYRSYQRTENFVLSCANSAEQEGAQVWVVPRKQNLDASAILNIGVTLEGFYEQPKQDVITYDPNDKSALYNKPDWISNPEYLRNQNGV